MNYGYYDYLPEPLSEEEIIDLFKRYKDGDSEARDQICIHNLRFVRSQAAKFSKLGYDKEELFSIGSYGLLKAIEEFDFEKGVKFLSFSGMCIKNEIIMFLRREKKRGKDISLQSVLYTSKNGGEINLEDSLQDDTVNIEADFFDKATSGYIKKIIDELPNGRDKDIVKMAFGFDMERLTQEKIAEIFGLSKSNISRIIKKNLIHIALRLYNAGIIENIPQAFQGKKIVKKIEARKDKKR